MIRLQDWFAFALVLFTFGQGVVGYMQWDATNNQYKAMVDQNGVATGQLEQARKAIDQTERTLEFMQLEQRPWIQIQKPSVFETLSHPPDGVNFQLNIENVGKTPAYVCDIDFFAEMSDLIVTPDFEKRASQYLDKPRADTINIILPPGGPYSSPGQVRKELSDVPSTLPPGLGFVRIAMRVTYRDNAGNRYTSERWFSSDSGFKAFIDTIFKRDKME